MFGAWCEELQLSAFGETENEAFYNLIENIPLYFKVDNQSKRTKRFESKKRFFTPPQEKKVFRIPEFS